MDKTSLTYANLFEYQAALGLKGQEFNYLSASAYLPHRLEAKLHGETLN